MGRYDARIKAVQGLAASAIGQTITIAGTSYACIAGDLETRDQLTEAGILRTRSMETVIDEDLFATVPSIGTLGTYSGTILRITDAKHESAAGGLIRFRWEVQ